MGRVVKTVKLVVDSFGSFLGMEKGCIVLRDKKGNTKKYPMFETEIGEVVLQSGNLVSTGALSALGFWQIDVLATTRNSYPIAMLKKSSRPIRQAFGKLLYNLRQGTVLGRDSVAHH